MYYFFNHINKDSLGTNDAWTKAAQDVDTILRKRGYKELTLEFQNETKIGKLMTLLKLLLGTKDFTKKTKRGDLVIFQYPFRVHTIFMEVLFARLRRRTTKICLIIHDVNGLRYRGAIDKKEIHFFRMADYIVSHNKSMTRKLSEHVDIDRIVDLEIFDYLMESFNNIAENKGLENGVIVSGNLSKDKARYIYGHLNYLMDNNFVLYGPKFEYPDIDNYKGCYTPSEIPEKMKGSFGLVWDGDDIDTCSGACGTYLKYNNPHKTSLYLVSGFPVIVWKEAALADFVLTNKVGFAISSLKDIPGVLRSMTNEEYQLLLKNVGKMSEKLSQGYYLNKALDRIISMNES